jgi:hypothetical protein
VLLGADRRPKATAQPIAIAAIIFAGIARELAPLSGPVKLRNSIRVSRNSPSISTRNTSPLAISKGSSPGRQMAQRPESYLCRMPSRGSVMACS